MKGKRIAVTEWILLSLLTLSQVSGFMVVKVDDLKEKEVVSNVLNVLKDNSARDENNIKNEGTNVEVGRALVNASRKSQNFKGFQYKKLVKRFVPHGYEVKEYEYDDKFKTLFKPLVRIHRKKPDPNNFNDKENKYDVLYLLDDKQFKDTANSNREASLLQPFSTDSAEIIYLEGEDEVAEYLKNTRGKFLNLNPQPKTRSKSRLVDNVGKLEYNHFDENKLPKALRLGTRMRDETKYNKKPVTTNLYKVLNHIAQYTDKPSNRKVKPKKTHRFGSVFSNQLKSQQDKYDPIQERRLRSESIELSDRNRYNNNKSYLDIINLVRALVEEKNQEMETDRQSPKAPVGWFGPVGAIMSKQYIKVAIPNESMVDKTQINQHELRYVQPVNDFNDLPSSLKALIQRKRETYDRNDSDDDRSMMDYESAVDNNDKELFVPVGHINSKQIRLKKKKRDIDLKPAIYNLLWLQKRKDKADASSIKSKSNKMKLLQEKAQLKANNMKRGQTYKFKEKMHREAQDLRTHVKSDEEDPSVLELKKLLDSEETQTTKKPNIWMPNYPFWNYWTYDKQIHQDECKGKLIQSGRLCVGAYA